jgi:hypothetical protein
MLGLEPIAPIIRRRMKDRDSITTQLRELRRMKFAPILGLKYKALKRLVFENGLRRLKVTPRSVLLSWTTRLTCPRRIRPFFAIVAIGERFVSSVRIPADVPRRQFQGD